VIVAEAPPARETDAGTAVQEVTDPLQDELNDAVAAMPPVLVTVNP
jgi:hypothetical protein